MLRSVESCEVGRARGRGSTSGSWKIQGASSGTLGEGRGWKLIFRFACSGMSGSKGGPCRIDCGDRARSTVAMAIPVAEWISVYKMEAEKKRSRFAGDASKQHRGKLGVTKRLLTKISGVQKVTHFLLRNILGRITLSSRPDTAYVTGGILWGVGAGAGRC